MVTMERKDKQGRNWTIPADGPRSSKVNVWWSREPLKKDKMGKPFQEEHLVLRQVCGDKVDVIMLTFGQVYDAIDAMNKAVDNG